MNIYCIGARTNRFLSIWYGFTYEKNPYDSLSFRVNLYKLNNES
jgi:hypothetical protein